jgi:hypothetical protein
MISAVARLLVMMMTVFLKSIDAALAVVESMPLSNTW